MSMQIVLCMQLTLATLAATDTTGLSTVSATPSITSPPAIFSLSFIEVLGSASACFSAMVRPVLIAASAYWLSVEGTWSFACLAACLAVLLRALEIAPSGFPPASFCQSLFGLPTYPIETCALGGKKLFGYLTFIPWILVVSKVSVGQSVYLINALLYLFPPFPRRQNKLSNMVMHNSAHACIGWIMNELQWKLVS